MIASRPPLLLHIYIYIYTFNFFKEIRDFRVIFESVLVCCTDKPKIKRKWKDNILISYKKLCNPNTVFYMDKTKIQQNIDRYKLLNRWKDDQVEGIVALECKYLWRFLFN